MIAVLLAKKIASLFISLLAGFILVRAKVLSAGDSRVVNAFSIHVIMPSMCLVSFQKECSKEVLLGFGIAIIAAIFVHAFLILFSNMLRKPLKLSKVEQCSIIYTNGGNLIFPIVASLFGPEYFIYCNGFSIVQTILVWSHCRKVMNGEKTINWKKFFTNTNVISILLGFILFFTGLRFPAPVQDALESMGGMVGVFGMFIVGMLLGGLPLRQVFIQPRVYLISAIRLVAAPAIPFLVYKTVLLWGMIPDCKTILFISFLSVMAPAANMVTQMAQLTGADPEQASIIGIVSTLCCIVTMPVWVYFFNL